MVAKANDRVKFERTFLISALSGDGCPDFLSYLAGAVPPGPWLYPEDQVSDLPLRALAAEITREKLFLRLHDELPYASTVETEQWKDLPDGSARIEQTIYVERESQKRIVIGHKGETIKAISMAARADIQEMAEKPVPPLPVRQGAGKTGPTIPSAIARWASSSRAKACRRPARSASALVDVPTKVSSVAAKKSAMLSSSAANLPMSPASPSDASKPSFWAARSVSRTWARETPKRPRQRRDRGRWRRLTGGEIGHQQDRDARIALGERLERRGMVEQTETLAEHRDIGARHVADEDRIFLERGAGRLDRRLDHGGNADLRAPAVADHAHHAFGGNQRPRSPVASWRGRVEIAGPAQRREHRLGPPAAAHRAFLAEGEEPARQQAVAVWIRIDMEAQRRRQEEKSGPDRS